MSDAPDNILKADAVDEAKTDAASERDAANPNETKS